MLGIYVLNGSLASLFVTRSSCCSPETKFWIIREGPTVTVIIRATVILKKNPDHKGLMEEHAQEANNDNGFIITSCMINSALQDINST